MHMRRTLLLLALLIVGLFPSVRAGDAPSDKDPPEPVWRKVCADPKKPETCRLKQQLFVTKKIDGKQKNLGRILGLTVVYAENAKTKKRQPYLGIRLPLGVDLRPGIVIKVDEGKEVPLKYLRCTKAGCEAGTALDKNMLWMLGIGYHFYVGFRPWGGDKTTVLKASLTGFKKAFAELR